MSRTFQKEQILQLKFSSLFLPPNQSLYLFSIQRKKYQTCISSDFLTLFTFQYTKQMTDNTLIFLISKALLPDPPRQDFGGKVSTSKTLTQEAKGLSRLVIFTFSVHFSKF